MIKSTTRRKKGASYTFQWIRGLIADVFMFWIRAHNVINALLKRLAHRNPNVQLYTLSLTDALSKNCGILVNREIASRAFTQGLEKIVTDRVSY